MGQYEEIAKRHSESVLDVAELLYGDGAWEVSKALTKQEKRERTQARIGLASNVVGLAAGVAGTKDAYNALQEKRGKAPYQPKHLGGVRGKLVNLRGGYAIPLAGAALGLQGANIAGDAVANRVLARSAKADGKKPKEIHKASTKGDEVTDPPTVKGKLVKVGVKAGFGAAKKMPEGMDNAKVKAHKVKAISRDAGDQVKTHVIKRDLDLTWSGEISKMDTDKRQVFGWASIIEMDGKPVVDLQGDMMTLEVIEKAAYDYVKTSRKGGNQHQRDGEGPKHVSDMIESFLVTEDKKKQMGLPDGTPTGWWVGFQINDDETWEQVKKGERKEFSIHGSGVRKELEIDD